MRHLRAHIECRRAKAQRKERKEGSVRENEIAKGIVDAAYKIHTRLGPGLLESVYEAAMAYELRKRGLRFERQKPIPIVYEEVHLEEGFRADFIVENLVIIELKSVEAIAPVHKKQLLPIFALPTNVSVYSSISIQNSLKTASLALSTIFKFLCAFASLREKKIVTFKLLILSSKF
jgi:GxxExxY protein